MSESSATSARQALDKAAQFACDNLQQISLELLQWRNTTILIDGKVRQMAMILSPIWGSDALRMAESIATKQALRKTAGLW